MSLLPGKKRSEHKQPRVEDDFYAEPDWCVRQLFATVRFRGPIHDPACGRGTIVEEARRAGYEATGSDLINRGFGETGVRFQEDFRPRTTLVFNSPSGQHEEFILHALEVASEAVAVIVPIPFLCGQERYWDLYRPCPPAYVFSCSQRPSMPPGDRPDIPQKGGTADYCWLIWVRKALLRSRDPRFSAGANGWWCSPHGTIADWIEPIAPLRRRQVKRDTAAVVPKPRRAKKAPDAASTAPGVNQMETPSA